MNAISLEAKPWQYAASATGPTEVVGLTVIVNVRGVPTQPLADGVTVIVATTGAVPVFVAVNDVILPLPEAANPIVGSLFVQVYVVPVTGLVNVMALVVEPLQYTALETVAMVVVGFTVMVNVRGVPAQPLADGVTVIVATTGAVPVFVAVNDNYITGT